MSQESLEKANMVDLATYEMRDASRLEAFSDGVFAVTITLLVLDIKVPQADSRHLIVELIGQWPQYLAYFYSFITVGIYWMNHHNIFKYVRRVDQTLMFLNILFLAFIGLMPFATSLLAANLSGGRQLSTDAAFVFNATALISAVSMACLWRYALTRPQLFEVQTNSELIKSLTFDYQMGQVFCLLALFLVFVSVPLALGLTFVLNVYFGLSELIRANKKAVKLNGT